MSAVLANVLILAAAAVEACIAPHLQKPPIRSEITNQVRIKNICTDCNIDDVQNSSVDIIAAAIEGL